MKTSAFANSRPRVALLVETSLAPGRDILRGIARYVREHNAWSLYHEAHGLEESVPRWLRRWRGDGIIARIQTPAMAEAIGASGIPVIDVLGVVPDLGFPLVHVDNVAIASMAAEHLIERGLRQFGFFGIEKENWSRQRYAAFCAAVASVQSNVSLYELPRNTSGVRAWEPAQDRLAHWISKLPKPAGILVCSDQRGAQFLEACRRARVLVPDEVAVISVDNDESLCDVCDPPMSSVDPNHVAVGYQAAILLDKMLSRSMASQAQILVKPQQVIARLSTDMLAIDDVAIAAALRSIRDRACDGADVDTIARLVGLSRSVLQRRFRALLKRGVHEEIVMTKVKRARELLIKTDLPLAVIAERAGFTHQEYMGAVFKARLGSTPARIRRGSN